MLQPTVPMSSTTGHEVIGVISALTHVSTQVKENE